MLGGDPDDLRSHARAVRAWADDVDAAAAGVRSAKGVDWLSTAAQGFRDRLDEKARDTQGVASSMRDAAEKIDHLANTLESRQQTLLHLLEKAGKTIADAEELVRNGASDVMSAAGHLADDAMDGVKDVAGAAKHGLDSLTGGLL
jgi:methyl-accepting chemotaxis protein